MELENIKRTSQKMKNIWTKMKNTLQGLNCEVDEEKDQIRDWEDKKAENTQSEQQKENQWGQ